MPTPDVVTAPAYAAALAGADLDHLARRVLVTVADHADPRGRVLTRSTSGALSLGTLAHLTRTDRRTVRRILTRAERDGWLVPERRRARDEPHAYRLALPGLVALPGLT